MKTNSINSKLTLSLPSLHRLIPDSSWPATWTAHYAQLVHRLETGDNRWGMQAAMLIVQGNIVAPISLLIFQYYDFGYQDYFVGLAALFFLGVLVANLALLPVRLTLSIFWTNIIVHGGLIAWHLLNHSDI